MKLYCWCWLCCQLCTCGYIIISVGYYCIRTCYYCKSQSGWICCICQIYCNYWGFRSMNFIRIYWLFSICLWNSAYFLVQRIYSSILSLSCFSKGWYENDFSSFSLTSSSGSSPSGAAPWPCCHFYPMRGVSSSSQPYWEQESDLKSYLKSSWPSLSLLKSGQSVG